MSKTDTAQVAPPRLSLRGVQRYLNAVEAPRATNRRLVMLIVLLGVAVLMQSFGYMMLLPLKERVPYFIKEELDARGRPTGHVTVDASAARRWTAEETHIRYHLARWAEDLLTIDERTKDTRLPASYALLKGQALADWRQYVETQGRPLARLAERPETRVLAQVISITFLSETSAMVRVKLTDDRGGERRVQVNVTYSLIPPTTDEEVYRNPIGLWITAFGVVNELA